MTCRQGTWHSDIKDGQGTSWACILSPCAKTNLGKIGNAAIYRLTYKNSEVIPSEVPSGESLKVECMPGYVGNSQKYASSNYQCIRGHWTMAHNWACKENHCDQILPDPEGKYKINDRDQVKTHIKNKRKV